VERGIIISNELD